MPIAGKAIAAIVVMAALGFGAGYAVASSGDDPEPATPVKASGAELPAVPATGAKPRVTALGAAAALPKARARVRVRVRRARRAPAASETPAPSGPSATAEPAPTSAPTAAPVQPPPSRPVPTAPPDDIIEG